MLCLQILLWYIFLDLMISALRAFYLSYTAIKTYLIGQALSPECLPTCAAIKTWLIGQMPIAHVQARCSPCSVQRHLPASLNTNAFDLVASLRMGCARSPDRN